MFLATWKNPLIVYRWSVEVESWTQYALVKDPCVDISATSVAPGNTCLNPNKSDPIRFGFHGFWLTFFCDFQNQKVTVKIKSS